MTRGRGNKLWGKMAEGKKMLRKAEVEEKREIRNPGGEEET